MIRFDCDYLEGAHPKVLKRIVDANYEQTLGYGNDDYTIQAVNKIKEVCKSDNIDVHFLVGGTQTNLTVISSMLKPYHAVICADTAHINVHETGAIEAVGHKIITIKNEDGKISSNQIQEIIDEHYSSEGPGAEHTAKPKLVFLSLPTECGTNYTKKELKSIYDVCKANNLYLYIDGARLGYGLVAKDTDIKISDLPKLCDVFYIGGTKQGALFGEAVVITNDELKEDFRYCIKQRGALLAKGRLLALQFLALMDKDLYFTLSKQAIDLSVKIKEAFINNGYRLLYNSFTNQQFIIMPNDKLEKLSKNFTVLRWKKYDEENTVIRICTSWATTVENVDKLIKEIEKL